MKREKTRGEKKRKMQEKEKYGKKKITDETINRKGKEKEKKKRKGRRW